MMRLHGTGTVIAIIPLGHSAAPYSINAFHPHTALQVVTCILFLTEHKCNMRNKREMVEATERNSLAQSLHMKVDSPQQRVSISGTQPHGAESINQSMKDEKTTRGSGSPPVRNLLLLFINATSLGDSNCSIRQTVGSSSKPVDEGDLQHVCSLQRRQKPHKDFSNIYLPPASCFLSAGSLKFWHTTSGQR
jgi:hypothetical protein